MHAYILIEIERGKDNQSAVAEMLKELEHGPDFVDPVTAPIDEPPVGVIAYFTIGSDSDMSYLGRAITAVQKVPHVRRTVTCLTYDV